jgi:hypothetical protein
MLRGTATAMVQAVATVRGLASSQHQVLSSPPTFGIAMAGPESTRAAPGRAPEPALLKMFTASPQRPIAKQMVEGIGR